MHRLKQMKETLISCILTQMGDLNNTDTKELGEAVDMVKDLAEAIYYCTITEAMEKNKEEETRGRDVYHYTERYLYPEYMRDMDKDYGRMYYSGQGGQGRDGNSGSSSSRGNDMNTSYYTPMLRSGDYPAEMRDYREGRSPMSRRHYMEAKEMKKGSPEQMKELEKYIQELSHDITEMIEDATQEEKIMLQQKLSTLASKIK